MLHRDSFSLSLTIEVREVHQVHPTPHIQQLTESDFAHMSDFTGVFARGRFGGERGFGASGLYHTPPGSRGKGSLGEERGWWVAGLLVWGQLGCWYGASCPKRNAPEQLSPGASWLTN